MSHTQRHHQPVSQQKAPRGGWCTMVGGLAWLLVVPLGVLAQTTPRVFSWAPCACTYPVCSDLRSKPRLQRCRVHVHEALRHCGRRGRTDANTEGFQHLLKPFDQAPKEFDNHVWRKLIYQVHHQRQYQCAGQEEDNYFLHRGHLPNKK